jgi:ubiquitin-like protein Pup
LPQEQERKQTQKKGGDGDADAGQVETTAKGEKLKGEMDDILDEIDSVLEENAEEFVKSYVQKGGQ